MRIRERERTPGSLREGALARLPVTGADWSRRILRVPPGHDVSVSFTTAQSSTRHTATLERRGYRVVGVQPFGTAGSLDVADFVVSRWLLEAHPAWWRALVAHADRAFNLSHGPVHLAFEAVLRIHRAPLR
ncbi:MAG: hypothetical protein KY434_09335 [Actinobacteria bacterium]|nr:hypothetical protein [Actinomycetota bacterium]